MSKKYRQAFKETLCRCCLSPEDRRKHRDNNGHLYSTERSHTYVTMAGSNSTYYHSNNLKDSNRSRLQKSSPTSSYVSNQNSSTHDKQSMELLTKQSNVESAKANSLRNDNGTIVNQNDSASTSPSATTKMSENVAITAPPPYDVIFAKDENREDGTPL